MKNGNINRETKNKPNKKRAPYEAPAIIYEGLITTRAGTTPGPDSKPDKADPANIFGGGG